MAPPVGLLQLRVGRGMAPPAALLQLLAKLLGRVPADQLNLGDRRDPCCCCCCLITEGFVTGVTCSMDQTHPGHLVLAWLVCRLANAHDMLP
jgi:hypothetical protein